MLVLQMVLQTAPLSIVVLQVYYVLRKMEETGCDAFYDVHGDEEASAGISRMHARSWCAGASGQQRCAYTSRGVPQP